MIGKHIETLMYPGPQQTGKNIFGGINETSIRLFKGPKKIRTKPKKVLDNYFDRQKQYLADLKPAPAAEQVTETIKPVPQPLKPVTPAPEVQAAPEVKVEQPKETEAK